MNGARLRPLNVIGLNSGTSMDGIDAAMFAIHPRSRYVEQGALPQLKIELVGSVLEEFPTQFRRKMQKIVASGETSLRSVCLLNTALGELFAQAALRLARSARSTPLNLIGSHGQTVWHSPTPANFAGMNATGTLQLGEPAVIAARTGVPVVADFRPADVANGGEGAPLVAFADLVLFGKDGINTAVLNVGGISNLTIIDSSGKALMAFDTGPGNIFIDRACQRLLGTSFDADGAVARSGSINEKLLQTVLGNQYFSRVPPKTTGRELFGDRYADSLIDSALSEGVSNADILCTFTTLTARSIAKAYEDFVRPRCKIERLILGGGGANNSRLVEQIASFWPHQLKVMMHEDCGISTKFKESLLFALLGYTTYFGVPNNVPLCTGADKRVCLGKICTP